MKERGFVLAVGNKGRIVALDFRGEPFAVARWVVIRAKGVRAKLSNPVALQSIEVAREQIANEMAQHIKKVDGHFLSAVLGRIADIEEKRLKMAKAHVCARERLKEKQGESWVEEVRQRQERFAKGLRGFFELFSGQRRKIKRQNEKEAQSADARDQQELDALVFQ